MSTRLAKNLNTHRWRWALHFERNVIKAKKKISASDFLANFNGRPADDGFCLHMVQEPQADTSKQPVSE